MKKNSLLALNTYNEFFNNFKSLFSRYSYYKKFEANKENYSCMVCIYIRNSLKKYDLTKLEQIDKINKLTSKMLNDNIFCKFISNEIKKQECKLKENMSCYENEYFVIKYNVSSYAEMLQDFDKSYKDEFTKLDLLTQKLTKKIKKPEQITTAISLYA